MSIADENITEIFKALSHPLRQEIIFILAERESIGFTALQKALSLNSPESKKFVQVGTIYHHMKLLVDLVIQENDTKSWKLSDRGWFAYNLLSSSQDKNMFLKNGDLSKPSWWTPFFNTLAPPSLFFFIKRSVVLFIGWEILFLLAFALITSEAGLIMVFVFFTDLNTDHNFFISFGSIFLSWISFAFITICLAKYNLGSRIITKEDILTIFVFLGISLMPLGLFPFLVFVQILNLNTPMIPLIVAVLLQIWVIILTARGISVQFLIRMEKSGIISLISIYIMVLIGLISGF